MRTILFALVVVLAVGAGAFWLSGTGRDRDASPAGSEDAAAMAYDFQASEVVMQQMGADGRLQYQIEAEEITQLPDNGRISATSLTLFHDPPGTEIAGPYRWTLTAERAELPADGAVISFDGNVRARGRLQGRNDIPVTLSTGRLDYDLDAQEVTAPGDVALTWGSVPMQGSGLKVSVRTSELAMDTVNIKTGAQPLESIRNGTRAP